jgi:uncharacterized protein (UPF0335 family)
MAQSERNGIIRKGVRRIEWIDREIRRLAGNRRAEYRHLKQIGVDPGALHDLIRERRDGKETAGRRRRALSGLRRIVR